MRVPIHREGGQERTKLISFDSALSLGLAHRKLHGFSKNRCICYGMFKFCSEDKRDPALFLYCCLDSVDH